MSLTSNSRPRGFTLIELMVAMVVFSVLGLLSYRLLSNLALSRDSLERNRTETHELQDMSNTLIDDFMHIAPQGAPQLTENSPPEGAVWIGTQQDITEGKWFLRISRYNTRPMLGLEGENPLTRVLYRLKDGELQRRELEPWNRSLAEQELDERGRVLGRHVQSIDINVLRTRTDSGLPSWGSETLPFAVVLKFTSQKGEKNFELKMPVHSD